MTKAEKYKRALECLRLIANFGRNLPSDGLAKECLEDIGEPLTDKKIA